LATFFNEFETTQQCKQLRFVASPATFQSVDNEIIQERSKLHKRMCRVNKWQLLLLLHRVPWLQLLRRHSLVCLPSQPHLTWRLSTLRVSSQMLQAANTAMANEIQTQQYSSYQSPCDNDALSRIVQHLRTASEQYNRMISYLQCERSYQRPMMQEDTFGSRKCIDCTGVADTFKRGNPMLHALLSRVVAPGKSIFLDASVGKSSFTFLYVFAHPWQLLVLQVLDSSESRVAMSETITADDEAPASSSAILNPSNQH
jgi:hypothetical protein